MLSLSLYALYRQAFNVAILFWFLCSAFLSSLSFTVVSDEAAVQERVRSKLTPDGTPMTDDEAIETFNAIHSTTCADNDHNTNQI